MKKVIAFLAAGTLLFLSACSDGSHISPRQAQLEALSAAGFTDKEVQELSVYLDAQDAETYIVEFSHEGEKYSYKINAQNGSIMYGEDGSEGTSAVSVQYYDIYIGETEAKNIALKDIGVTEADVEGLTVELLGNDNTTLYKVSYKYGDTNYSYDIDALTGEIIRISQDKDVQSSQSGEITSAETSASSSVQDNYIGEDAAKDIALSHAGVNEADVTGLRARFDIDDGKEQYDVEFWVGNTEYDYEINAVTGQIISYDIDTENAPPQTVAPAATTSAEVTAAPPEVTASTTAAAQQGYIGEEAAKAAALKHAGLTENNVYGIKVKFDIDDGRAKYEVEFRSESTEYDYEIDAVTGNVLSFEKDVNDDIPQSSAGSYIGEEAAKAAALKHAGLSENNVYGLRVKFDIDDGRAKYEVDFRSGNTEYEYEIDAENGSIIKSENERH